MIRVIQHSKIWFVFSATLVTLSLCAFGFWGLRYGIDFTGGSLMEVSFTGQRPTNQQIVDVVAPFNVGSVTVQPIGEQGALLRFKDVTEETHQNILGALRKNFTAEQPDQLQEMRFESIGPAVGQQLKEKTAWAILLSLIGIILYVAWAFRKVSQPVSSWKYGLAAVIALFHDVIITIGIFVVLGKLYGLEVNAPFVAALLTILGYSVNDTIVVFDRIRENLLRRTNHPFEQVVEDSISQTFTRSINTSMTVLLTLLAILLFGGESIRDFALALIVGISFGTYSSIFLASPLLVYSAKMKR